MEWMNPSVLFAAVDPIAFCIGPVCVRWYGLLIATALLIGAVGGCYACRKAGIDEDDFLTIFMAMAVAAIIGARAYYVIFNLPYYLNHPDQIIAVWNGGLAIYGGLIAGFFTLLVVSKIKRISFPKILDVVAPAVMVGQAIGRWGNFMNGEAYGYNPEKIALYANNIFRMDIRAEGSDFVRHTLPTFLFESVWNVIGLLVIIFVIDKIKKYDGQIVLFYITWYGFGRGWIEMLRSDSLYLFDIKVSSLLGFLCFIAGVILMAVFSAKEKRRVLDDAHYDSIYSDDTDGEGNTDGESDV